MQAGWLKCSPNRLSGDPYDENATNIMGRNSFITAFGSIARPLSKSGQQPGEGERVCRSSTFSPGNNVFRYDNSTCCVVGFHDAAGDARITNAIRIALTPHWTTKSADNSTRKVISTT